jgi:Family of unknown function (DUF6893)
MGENRVGETKLREQQELAAEANRSKPSANHLVWKIVGGAALALVAAGLITSLSDIRRYIRISRM